MCVCVCETGRYAALQVEFSAAVKTSAEQKELIFKLEHDLSTIQTMSSLSRPDAEVHHTGRSECKRGLQQGKGDSSEMKCEMVASSDVHATRVLKLVICVH